MSAVPYCLKKIPVDSIPDLKQYPIVYFLWYEDECVYVGQTHKIYTRTIQHKADKLFTMVSYISVKESSKLTEVELYYIRLLQPFYNKNTIRKISKLDKYYEFENSVNYNPINRGTDNKRKEDIIEELFAPKFNGINKKRKATPLPRIKNEEKYVPYYEEPEYREYNRNKYKIISTPSKLFWKAYLDLSDGLLKSLKDNNTSQWIIDLIERIQHHNNTNIQFSMREILTETKKTATNLFQLSYKEPPEELIKFEVEDFNIEELYKGSFPVDFNL